jgi:hypothetical protein
MTKCIAKSYKKEPCVFHRVGDTQFCKNHQYMVDYTNDMMDNLELCVGCDKMYYLNGYKSCEKCRERGKANRELAKKEAVKCAKEGCKFKKSNENKYCGKHQADFFVEELKEKDMKPCKNYIRGCRAELDKDYKYSGCSDCLQAERDKDHKRRGAAAKAPKEEGMLTCTVCCKSQPESMYIGLKGITKTCSSCRVSFAREDQRRDKEHVKELARVNAQKPERKEVKRKWRLENMDKFIGYWIKFLVKHINELCGDKFILDNVELAKEDKAVNYLHTIKDCIRNNILFELSYPKYKTIVVLPCNYCGTIRETGFNGIDKVDPKKGYVPENCVSCCRMCNEMKKNINVNLFLNIVEHIVTYNKKGNGKLCYELLLNNKTLPSYNRYIQGAVDRDLEFKLSKEYFMKEILKPCYICGHEVDEYHNNGLDRFDNDKGYLENNVKSCCGTCNFMKKEYVYEDFMNKCVKIFNYKINGEITVEEYDPMCDIPDEDEYRKFEDEVLKEDTLENVVTENVIIKNEISEKSLEVTNDVLANPTEEIKESIVKQEDNKNEPNKHENIIIKETQPQELNNNTKMSREEHLRELNRLKKQRQRERQREKLGDEGYKKLNAEKMKAYRESKASSS